MSGWITYQQAAAILGCHISNVPKLVAKRHLQTRGYKQKSNLDRAEVEALAERRRAEGQRRILRQPASRAIDRRPDSDHEWLSTSQTASLLGVTTPAVLKRVHRDRLPAVTNLGRCWVRRDHLEMVEAARLVTKTRQP